MAEGMLGEILGGGDEKPEVETDAASAGAAAFASTVAARLSANDPDVSRKTAEFLTEQSQLLKVQKEHLEQEHGLRLASLRNHLSEQNLRRFGLRLRTAFQLFLTLFGAALGFGLMIMIYDAFHTRNVVIDVFDAPSALAAQGLSGKVLASGFLDVLTKIQTATRSSADHPSLSTAWTNDISIEVPGDRAFHRTDPTNAEEPVRSRPAYRR